MNKIIIQGDECGCLPGACGHFSLKKFNERIVDISQWDCKDSILLGTTFNEQDNCICNTAIRETFLVKHLTIPNYYAKIGSSCIRKFWDVNLVIPKQNENTDLFLNTFGCIEYPKQKLINIDKKYRVKNIKLFTNKGKYQHHKMDVYLDIHYPYERIHFDRCITELNNKYKVKQLFMNLVIKYQRYSKLYIIRDFVDQKRTLNELLQKLHRMSFYKLRFGKYHDSYFKQVYENDENYCDWLIETIPNKKTKCFYEYIKYRDQFHTIHKYHLKYNVLS